LNQCIKNENHDDLSTIRWTTLIHNIYLEKHLSVQGFVINKKALVVGYGLSDDEFALFEKENEIKSVAPYQCYVLYRK